MNKMPYINNSFMLHQCCSPNECSNNCRISTVARNDVIRLSFIQS